MKGLTGLTSSGDRWPLGLRYSARVVIVVRVGIRFGIQHSLSFGRLWSRGLEGGSCSTLEPGERSGHDCGCFRIVEGGGTGG